VGIIGRPVAPPILRTPSDSAQERLVGSQAATVLVDFSARGVRPKRVLDLSSKCS